MDTLEIVDFPSKIRFNNMDGTFVSENNKEFLKKVCNIDTNDYEYSYTLNDKWAGSYLFIKDKDYRFIKCGSGRPIVSDRTGKLDL